MHIAYTILQFTNVYLFIFKKRIMNMNYKCVSSMQKIILLMIIAYLHLINLSNKLNISWEDVLIQFVFINSFSLIRKYAKIIIINKNLIESRCLNNGMKCSIIKIFYQRSK